MLPLGQIRMAKQKRKVTEMTEKKNKKLKKASTEETLLAPQAVSGTEQAHPEGEAVLGARQEPAPQLPALTPEEKRVLERKLKKERRKEERKWLRESGAAQSLPAKRSGAQLALDYLCGWAEKHENWRFQKTRQTWLLMHMYDSDQVPDALFSTLLAYLEGLRGRARELTVQKAEALMQEVDKASGAEPFPLGKTQRIRRVLQLLS
ncbi:protein cholesin isoform X2 [Callorhinus ursinus]|uniref:protein cholesin isoform X2 n=1 Tax=Callorhinus ursinus TaxID=34884 RepID=UPI003CD0321C